MRSLLRRPYEAGAEGPEAFDCFGLVRHVERELFGRVVERTPEGMLRMRRNWAPAALPTDGAVVVMRGGDRHVGVWLADAAGVLHALEGHGVTFDSPSVLHHSGFGEPRYFNHRCRTPHPQQS